MSIKKPRDQLHTTWKASTSAYAIKANVVRVKYLDINCVEMGVEAVEMD